MEEHRGNIAGIIMGGRNTGKTFFASELSALYPARNMKVLVIDTLDHPKYRHVPIMPHSRLLQKWEGLGTYRLIISKSNKFEEIIEHLNDFFWNGLLIFEDAYKYIDTKLPKPVSQFIIDTKQKNVDVLFMYHAWGWTPIDLFRICDLIEVFPTNDGPEVRKREIKGIYKMALEAHNFVTSTKQKWPHKTVELGG